MLNEMRLVINQILY